MHPHREAETEAHAWPRPADADREGLGRELVGDHQRRGVGIQEAASLPLAAAAHHHQKVRIVPRGAHQPAAAGEKTRGLGEPVLGAVTLGSRSVVVRREDPGQAVVFLGGAVKARVGHVQRVKEALLQKHVEPLARHTLDHQPQHLDRQGVLPPLARLIGQHQPGQTRGHVFEVLGPKRIGGDVQRIDGVTKRPIRQPRGVTHQIRHGHRPVRRDQRVASLHLNVLELGDVVRYRVVKFQLAFINQHERCGRGHGLGHRPDAEDRVGLHRCRRIGGALAVGLEMRDLAVLGDEHHRAGDLAIVHKLLHRRVHRRPLGVWQLGVYRLGSRHRLSLRRAAHAKH